MSFSELESDQDKVISDDNCSHIDIQIEESTTNSKMYNELQDANRSSLLVENNNVWINMQRNSTECNEHWQLRKQFLMKNVDIHNKETLLCLAQLYVNINTLGCRYSKEIMERVQSLSGNIGHKYKQRETLQRTFVSASDAASSKIQAPIEQKLKDQRMPMTLNQFVPASNTSGNESSQLNTRIIKTKHENEDDTLSFKSSKSFKTGHSSTSQPIHSDIHLMDQIDQQQHSVNKFIKNKNNFLLSFNRSFLEKLSSNVIMIDTRTVFKVIIENFFNKLSIHSNYIVENTGPNLWSCCLELNWRGKISKGADTKGQATRALAMEAASKNLLINLSQVCRIIVKRKNCMSEINDKINLEDISVDKVENPFTYKPLNDANVGSKMLKLMGWSGGGLGIRNDGIIEPVKSYDSTGAKKGVGFKQTININQIRTLLDKYARSDVLEDLVFSPDIPKETRAEIHKIVITHQKLRSVSRNEDGNRYLTIKKIFDFNNLANYLASEGGESGCYKLFNPGTLDFSQLDDFKRSFIDNKLYINVR